MSVSAEGLFKDRPSFFGTWIQIWELDLLALLPPGVKVRTQRSKNPVKKIKILLADYPHALSESVKSALRSLKGRQDRLIEDSCRYEVEELDVNKDHGPMDILLWVGKNKPDDVTLALVVVLGLGKSEESGVLDHLHTTDRALTILGIAPDSKSAFIEQLCPWRREVIDLSVEGFYDAIRKAIMTPCA